jgi:hypothetical protein
VGAEDVVDGGEIADDEGSYMAEGEIYRRVDNSYTRLYADPDMLVPKLKLVCSQHKCTTKIKPGTVCGECATGRIGLQVGFCDAHIDHQTSDHDEMFEEYGLWVDIIGRSTLLRAAFGCNTLHEIKCMAIKCHRCGICPSTLMRAGNGNLWGICAEIQARDCL